MPVANPTPAKLRRALLGWFDRNQRPMPWRGTRNPYRIWVSEIMLQQTRVTAVTPYYRRFLKRFPNIGSLARARDILRWWAGLGYYSRARNLHRAARQIVTDHGGKFPRTLEAALKLPGVGDYTARAVLSMAYGQRYAVVDGNVARVLIRVFALRKLTIQDRKQLQPCADNLLSSSRPGDFNQAMMELGATVCLPRQPLCHSCPLEKHCLAHARKIETRLPARIEKRKRPVIHLTVLVPRRNGKVMLTRETNGYFSGLWHFPYEVRRTGKIRGRALTRFVHQTTMRDLAIEAFPVTGRPGLESNQKSGAMRWVAPAGALKIGVGAATRKILAAMKNSGRSTFNQGRGTVRDPRD